MSEEEGIAPNSRVRSRRRLPRLHQDANRRAGLLILIRASSRVPLLNVLLESRTPDVMGIARTQIRRRGIHNQKLLAERTLPSDAAKLSEECEIGSHGPSIG